MKRLSIVMLMVAIGVACGAPASADSTKVIRHLSYTFTYGTNNNLTVDNSGIDNTGSGSGNDSYRGSNGDEGTISVDVVGIQPDGGLVVSVSEQARNSRTNKPTTCVTYPNTNVICDPSQSPNEEELTLLRFLARGFVDPSRIDAKNHWKIGDSSPQFSIDADYDIVSQSGGVMQITENRQIKTSGAQSYTSNTNAKLSYDPQRVLPLVINEYTIVRTEHGIGRVSVQKTEIDLKLESDSLQPTKT